jgi:hypothetical protein
MAFGKIRGRHGELSIPAMGAVIGRFDGQDGFWELTRHESGQQQGKPVVYRFHAVLSYLNRGFWEDPRFSKELTLKVGSELFRVEPIEGQRMELSGRTLQSGGVQLWPVDPS